MLTEQDVLDIINGGESDRVKFTTSTRDLDKFAEAVCSFANDLPHHDEPGYLLIGVSDEGRIAGIDITDSLLRKLGDIRSMHVTPPTTMVVEKVTCQDGDVAVVTVQPHPDPPVRFKGKAHVRVGPRRSTATYDEERTLAEKRGTHPRTYDARPVAPANLDELVPMLYNDYLYTAIGRSLLDDDPRNDKEKLSAVSFYDLRTDSPTVGGVIMFGRDARFYFPGAYVHFLKVDGTEITDPVIDDEEIGGDLRSIIEVINTRVTAYNRRIPHRIEGTFREETISDYPNWAIRELLLNSVLHRSYESSTPVRFHWYSDRIEIINPGGLYGGTTKDSFANRTAYRNPTIATALRTMGYINRFGRGIRTAKDELARNGNSEPVFDIDDNFFSVTVRRVRS